MIVVIRGDGNLAGTPATIRLAVTESLSGATPSYSPPLSRPICESQAPLISYLIAQAAISYTPALSLPLKRHYFAISEQKGWVGRDSNPEPTP